MGFRVRRPTQTAQSPITSDAEADALKACHLLLLRRSLLLGVEQDSCCPAGPGLVLVAHGLSGLQNIEPSQPYGLDGAAHSR